MPKHLPWGGGYFTLSFATTMLQQVNQEQSSGGRPQEWMSKGHTSLVFGGLCHLLDMTAASHVREVQCPVKMWPSGGMGGRALQLGQFVYGKTTGIVKTTIFSLLDLLLIWPKSQLLAFGGGCSTSLFYEDRRLCPHLPKNSPSAPSQFVGGQHANLASANESVGCGLPSLVCSSSDLRYLDNSMAFILSRVPVRWLNSLSSSLKSEGIYMEGWASVVVDEQFLLCTVCCSGQSPLVVLTVFKTILIFKSLIIIIWAFEKLCSQKHVTI